MKKIFPFIDALLMPFCAEAETVRLIPARDTDIYSFTGNPTSTSFSLGVSTTPTRYSTLHSQKSLIEFDLRSVGIPAGEIGRAVLRLYVLPTDPTYGDLAPGDVHVHVQGKAWDSTANWSTFDPREEVGVIPAEEIAMDVWVELDITEAVKNWISGATPNYGLVLKPLTDRADPDMNVSFASVETDEDGIAPELLITRAEVVEPGEPPVLAISREGEEVVLEWPVAGSEGWALKWAEDLAGEWADWAGTPVEEDGHWRVTAAADLPRAFFRLEK